jgi:hypothetical protein
MSAFGTEAAARSGATKIVAALALHFFSVAALVVSRTYIDLLFLGTYSRQLLPHFFLAQTLAILAMTFVTKPLISRGSSRINALILLTFAATIGGSYALVIYPLPGAAFGICIWLALAGTMVGVMAWTAVGDAFDVRQFKRLAKWVNAAGSGGALIVGSLVPLLIAVLGAEQLIFALAGLVAIAALLLLALPALPVRGLASASGKAKPARSPLSHPLFRQLAAGVGLLALVDTFADYALKAELAANFDKAGIGRFMGPFYALASVLTLGVQLGGSDALLRLFGVSGLLGPMPVIGLLTALALIALPGLWTAAVLRMGQNVLRYALDTLGREIAARPLPGSIRRAGKLLLKGLATPVGAGLGAIVLWVAAERLGLRGLGALIAGASLVWAVVAARTGGAYRETLQEAVSAGRLALTVDEMSGPTLKAARSVAREVLERDRSEEVALFGLQLLEQAGEGSLPRVVERLLAHESADVRASAAKAARSFEAVTAAPALAARLADEADAEVRWLLFEHLAEVAPESALEAARSSINEQASPQARAGAVLVLLATGDLDDLSAATAALREMIAAAEPSSRQGAARALGALTVGKLDGELSRLIGDPDESVSVAAIRAAGQRRATGLASALAARLGVGQAAHYAGQALVTLGEAALPAVLEVARGQAPAQARAAVRVLAQLDGDAAEGELAPIIVDASIWLRRALARAVLERARTPGLGLGSALRQASRTQVLAEATAAASLGQAAAIAEDEGVVAELRARQRLARERLLCWFAALTRPREVAEVAAAVLGDGDLGKRATALELCDALADRELRPALAVLEGDASPRAFCKPLDAIGDPWIVGWLAACGGARGEREMDIAKRVMLLRRVALFASLPGETLVTIAESCELRELTEGEQIFAAGDPPDGLYVIASGRVNITRKEQVLVELAPSEFFGEVALLDDEPRMANAIASQNGVALFIGREVFHRVTDDLPEVLRAVNRALIRYLKHTEQTTGKQTVF